MSTLQNDTPLYKSTPTFRDYEMYILADEYTKGWNEAMDYIFGERKHKRKPKFKVISGGQDDADRN